jgi:hypothetical protein
VKEHLLIFLLRVRSTVASRQWSARCARRSRDSEQKLASSPRGRAICRRPLSCRLRLSQLSIRFNVPYHIISFQEAKAVVLLPFVMPPRENTRGVEWEAAAGTVSGRVCWVYLLYCLLKPGICFRQQLYHTTRAVLTRTRNTHPLGRPLYGSNQSRIPPRCTCTFQNSFEPVHGDHRSAEQRSGVLTRNYFATSH